MQQSCLCEETEAFQLTHPVFQFEVNSSLFQRYIEELDSQVSLFLNLITAHDKSYHKDIQDFFSYISSNPAVGKPGSTGLGSLFWLFLIARSLNPSIIIESGVFIGSSLHCFRLACQTAQLYGFDVNLKKLLFQDETIQLHEKDWSEVNIATKSDNDLCYFDDHINNGLRIRQAFERGFKNLIFDDVPYIGDLYKFRYPGLPTVPMIMSDKLKDGDEIKWFHKKTNKHLKYIYHQKDTYGARELIEFVKPIPSLSSFISCEVGLQYFVKLK